MGVVGRPAEIGKDDMDVQMEYGGRLAENGVCDWRRQLVCIWRTVSHR